MSPAIRIFFHLGILLLSNTAGLHPDIAGLFFKAGKTLPRLLLPADARGLQLLPNFCTPP